MIYTTRPPASRRGARVAWDVLRSQAESMTPPRQIQHLWYSRSMRPYPWCVRLDGAEDYIDLDELEVRDRVNNPHKYPTNGS